MSPWARLVVTRVCTLRLSRRVRHPAAPQAVCLMTRVIEHGDPTRSTSTGSLHRSVYCLSTASQWAGQSPEAQPACHCSQLVSHMWACLAWHIRFEPSRQLTMSLILGRRAQNGETITPIHIYYLLTCVVASCGCVSNLRTRSLMSRMRGRFAQGTECVRATDNSSRHVVSNRQIYLDAHIVSGRLRRDENEETVLVDDAGDVRVRAGREQRYGSCEEGERRAKRDKRGLVKGQVEIRRGRGRIRGPDGEEDEARTSLGRNGRCVGVG